MNAIALNQEHRSNFAAIRLQGASVIASGCMPKYGPNTGSEQLMLEVRG